MEGRASPIKSDPPSKYSSWCIHTLCSFLEFPVLLEIDFVSRVQDVLSFLGMENFTDFAMAYGDSMTQDRESLLLRRSDSSPPMESDSAVSLHHAVFRVASVPNVTANAHKPCGRWCQTFSTPYSPRSSSRRPEHRSQHQSLQANSRLPNTNGPKRLPRSFLALPCVGVD